MLIHDIMTRNVECVGPNTTIQDAARKMRDLDCGPLPVCGSDDRLAGIITDRDIAIRAVAEGLDCRTTVVRDVMTPGIICCFEDQDVSEAAHRMEVNQVRRLAVLDHDKRLVGIVSLGDLAVKTRDEMMVGEAIEAVSEPTHV
jgi:CBS domain-containing protein